MRIHRVSSSAGCSAFLDVYGYGANVRARVRVVRDADGAMLYTPPFALHSRDSVVQWAVEFGQVLVSETFAPRDKPANDA